MSDTAKVYLIAAVVATVCLIAGCAVSAGTADQVLLDWIYFPMETLPKVTIHWPSIILFLICMAAFLPVFHGCLGWLSKLRDNRDDSAEGNWSYRSTVLTTLGIGLLFAAGTAMVAATHQVVWMFSGSGSDSESRPFGFINDTKRSAHEATHRNNLKAAGLALMNFEETFETLPPGGTMTHDGKLLHGWPILVAPYLSISQEGIDFTMPWNQYPNSKLYRDGLPVLINPALGRDFDKRGRGLSHIAANSRIFPIVKMNGKHDNAHFGLPKTYRIDELNKGDSHTILLGEVSSNLKPWGHPANVRDPAL
ncbi:MAG: hypothetical protein CMJ78_24850 [Planctomycetaceae bacterium]|nr:hypothetical protein [Planctomycetaceae bacterium]